MSHDVDHKQLYIVLSRSHGEELFPHLGELWLARLDAAVRDYGAVVVAVEEHYATILYAKNGVQITNRTRGGP